MILFAMACGRLPFAEKSIRGLIVETSRPLRYPGHKVSEGLVFLNHHTLNGRVQSDDLAADLC